VVGLGVNVVTTSMGGREFLMALADLAANSWRRHAALANIVIISPSSSGRRQLRVRDKGGDWDWPSSREPAGRAETQRLIFDVVSRSRHWSSSTLHHN
jgi:hypothetical protein